MGISSDQVGSISFMGFSATIEEKSDWQGGVYHQYYHCYITDGERKVLSRFNYNRSAYMDDSILDVCLSELKKAIAEEKKKREAGTPQ